MDTQYTAASMAHRAAQTPVALRMEPSTPSITDTLNMQAITQMLTDMALEKRATARRYARKRWALRQLVSFGVFTPEEARAKQSPLANLLYKWRLLRRELQNV